MKSVFDTWFEEQFGKRPGGNKSDKALTEDAYKKYRDYMVANELLIKREEHDLKRTAASYAWNAKGKTK